MTLNNVTFYRGRDPLAEAVIGVLTTDHPASSYGQPVAVVDGQVYGPGDGLILSGHETWSIQDSGVASIFEDILSGAIATRGALAQDMIRRWVALEAK